MAPAVAELAALTVWLIGHDTFAGDCEVFAEDPRRLSDVALLAKCRSLP